MLENGTRNVVDSWLHKQSCLRASTNEREMMKKAWLLAIPLLAACQPKVGLIPPLVVERDDTNHIPAISIGLGIKSGGALTVEDTFEPGWLCQEDDPCWNPATMGNSIGLVCYIWPNGELHAYYDNVDAIGIYTECPKGMIVSG